jgi:hypothetical protein
MDGSSCTGKIRYEEYRATRDADPDPAAKKNADPCRSESGPANLIKKSKKLEWAKNGGS